MQKRQDAQHAEFERKKRLVEEERLAKEEAELSFQPNVARREIEELYAQHNPERLADLDSLLAKYGERRLLALLRKKYLGADAKGTHARRTGPGRRGGRVGEVAQGSDHMLSLVL